MTVEAIQENGNRSALPTVVAATTVGGLTGYTAKYLLPLTSDEKDLDFKKAIEIIRKESKKVKAKSIDEIRTLPKKTLAQDTFLKMVDIETGVLSNNTKAKNLSKTFQMEQLKSKLSDVDRIELRNIINDVNEPARRMCSRCIEAYKGVIKKIRPLEAFILPGVALGFMVGVANNVLNSKTDYIA